MSLTRIVRCGVLLAVLSAGVCDRLFYARLAPESTPDRPVFLLGGSPDMSGPALVYRIAVSGRTRTGGLHAPWNEYWEIEKDSALRYVGLSRVEYGVVPERFRALAGPESLPSGLVYCFAPGCHGLSPQVYFQITADSLGARAIRELTEEEFQRIIRDSLPAGG